MLKKATMFALLAGFHNCGNSFAEFNGAWILYMSAARRDVCLVC